MLLLKIGVRQVYEIILFLANLNYLVIRRDNLKLPRYPKQKCILVSCTHPRMLPNRIIIYMYMISRYCWPVRIDWAILIPFFIKKCQKIQNFNYITCKGINLWFITPASTLSPGRLVIRYWPWSSGIWDKCGSEFWYSLTFQGFHETFHATKCSWLSSSKGYFCPQGPCNNVVRLGRIMGFWTNIECNAAYHGWVCHASVMIRRRDWSFLALASTFPVKQNGGNAYP